MIIRNSVSIQSSADNAGRKVSVKGGDKSNVTSRLSDHFFLLVNKVIFGLKCWYRNLIDRFFQIEKGCSYSHMYANPINLMMPFQSVERPGFLNLMNISVQYIAEDAKRYFSV